MSTGFECAFLELPDGRHFYTLQNWDCPVGAFDWTEYASTYGPFLSFEEAQQHLCDNHANPGGYSIGKVDTISPGLQAMIDNAEKPQARRRWA